MATVSVWRQQNWPVANKRLLSEELLHHHVLDVDLYGFAQCDHAEPCLALSPKNVKRTYAKKSCAHDAAVIMAFLTQGTNERLRR